MNKIWILSIILGVGSCTISPDDEVLYMKTENSYHPIYVRGNPHADTYLIWVHGGPGSSGLYFGEMPELAELQKKYRMVYWDQMSSGGTIGTPDKSDFTIEEFSTHVNGIVNIVNNRFKPKNLFMLGHSWGGMLSAYYLMANGDVNESKNRQSKLKGYITMNPVFDMPDAITNSLDFMTNYVLNEIHNNRDVDRWGKVLDWYISKNGLIRGRDVAQHFDYIYQAGGMAVRMERLEELTSTLALKMVFDSPFEFYSYFDNQSQVRTYLNVEDCSLVRPGRPTLNMIDIPTLMMIGELDKIAFEDDSIRWHGVLSKNKNAANFPLKIFERSAHSIFMDENDRFLYEIDNFVTQHKSK